MLAILLLCLVSIAVAQQPQPCTTPPQWEGRLFDTNEKQRSTVRGRVSYDSTYHRIRILEDIQVGGQEVAFDVLTLFDSKLVFIYDLRNHNCIRAPVTDLWCDFGISPGDTSYGEAYIGSSAFPGSGVLVTIWGGNYTLPTNETVPYIGTWTYQGCLPVSRVTVSEERGNEILSFFDVTVGISDPNVFIPRRECLTENEYALRNVLFGTPSKKNE